MLSARGSRPPRWDVGRPIALHPMLFAAYGVLYLYSVNLGRAAPEDVAAPLALSIGGAFLALVGVTIPFWDARRAAVVVSALIVAFFAYGHVANAIRPLQLAARFQLLGWLALIVVAVAVAIFGRARMRPITHGLNAASGALVVIALIAIVPFHVSTIRPAGVSVPDIAQPLPRVATAPRDIYYLVFDRYGSEWSLMYHFGVDRYDLPQWLRSRGFFVASDGHANYPMSELSLASSLNVTYLDGLTTLYGRNTGDRAPARALLRDHAVGRFLKSQGYTYHHVGSWWGPTQTNAIADRVHSWSPESQFWTVLRQTSALRFFDQLSARDRHREVALFQLRALRDIRRQAGPKFVFAHILLPHDPYVFKADGQPLTDREARATPVNAAFAGQFAYTNDRIRALVDELLEGPEASRPIVIIQGDEGPHLRGDVDWRRKRVEATNVRLGILNALYLPGGSAGPEPSASTTPVNTFRIVFNRYFGTELPLLPDRSYWWRSVARLYDFVDVTSRLRAAARLPQRPVAPKAPP